MSYSYSKIVKDLEQYVTKSEAKNSSSTFMRDVNFSRAQIKIVQPFIQQLKDIESRGKQDFAARVIRSQDLKQVETILTNAFRESSDLMFRVWTGKQKPEERGGGQILTSVMTGRDLDGGQGTRDAIAAGKGTTLHQKLHKYLQAVRAEIEAVDKAHNDGNLFFKNAAGNYVCTKTATSEGRIDNPEAKREVTFRAI